MLFFSCHVLMNLCFFNSTKIKQKTYLNQKVKLRRDVDLDVNYLILTPQNQEI